MANFGPLAAEICWRVWGTPTNFNEFRVLAALLHGTLVVSVSQTLRRSADGTIYIRQGGHPSLLALIHILLDICNAQSICFMYDWTLEVHNLELFYYGRPM